MIDFPIDKVIRNSHYETFDGRQMKSIRTRKRLSKRYQLPEEILIFFLEIIIYFSDFESRMKIEKFRERENINFSFRDYGRKFLNLRLALLIIFIFEL